MEECSKQGVQATRSDIAAAVKRVGKTLALAGGRDKPSSDSIIQKPAKKSSDIWRDISQYFNVSKIGMDPGPVVVLVSEDVENHLELPFLKLKNEDVEKKNFAEALASLLMQQGDCCLYFVIDGISRPGMSRLKLIIKDVTEMYDSRILILIKSETRAPSELNELIDKRFDVAMKRRNLDQETVTEKKKLRSSSVDSMALTIKNLEAELNKCKDYCREVVSAKNTALDEVVAKLEIADQTNKRMEEEVHKCLEDLKAKDLVTENVKTQEKLLVSKDQDISELKRSTEAFERFLSDKNQELEDLSSLKEKNEERMKSEISNLTEENEVLRTKLKTEVDANVAQKIRVQELLQEKELIASQSGYAENNEDLSDKSVNSLQNNQELANKSESIMLVLKSKILKLLQNEKLSAKTKVFRCFKHLKVEEIFETLSESNIKCILKVKDDSTNIFLDKTFTGKGSSKTKALMSAYSEFILLIKGS